MTRKDIIDKAYGGIPNEPVPLIDLSWIPTPRGVRYYIIKLKRFFTR